MESFEGSNCHSMSDSFSLYERYLRSFNVVDNLAEECGNREPSDHASNSDENWNSRSNVDLSLAVQQTNVHKHCETAELEVSLLNPITLDNILLRSSADTELCMKVDSPCNSLAGSFLENSSATTHGLNDKSDPAEVPATSEDSKFECFKQPIFITPTMENSNNAVDSVPMFRQVRPAENVFKLPTSELSFNGTIKHVLKLKPIVDPITALSSSTGLVTLDDKSVDQSEPLPCGSENCRLTSNESSCEKNCVSVGKCENELSMVKKSSESTGDSQYEEYNLKKACFIPSGDDTEGSKWNMEQSYSSLEASFDSGVRSPDLFSDEDDIDPEPALETFWSFLKDHEAYGKRRVKKMEERLQGILPPPSVTIINLDVTDMLKKYYSFLPAFTDKFSTNVCEENSKTPTKRVSFVEIPSVPEVLDDSESESFKKSNFLVNKSKNSTDSSKTESELDTSLNDKSVHLQMCTELEAKETVWPDVLKCKYHDVYYNVTKYSEKIELLALRYGERFVGAETDTSVNIYSGGLKSPSSASKRKALRLKITQAKSPGRRLSHLARRRQAFNRAQVINEKANTTKMVLIDKNFFPHRKLINTSERKSPRTRRTPGKKTPVRKTPGKKTPVKTPKMRSGGSSRKKAMRRLLMDSDSMTRTAPTRETLKRALFISPENRKAVPPVPSSSVPLQAMKSKRALFDSTITAETKSSDGSQSDQFLKRKRDSLGDIPESSRSKIAKSLSFGGDNIGNSQSVSFSRRASEVLTARNTAELNELHKKKLLWAVSEALRVHGWRMSSPGFREKASLLARLTRKLLALPPHAARLAAPNLSTSEIMLKLARQYVFAIIQGRTVEECFLDEQTKLASEANHKVSGYISVSAYQQMKSKQPPSCTFTSQIKENACNDGIKLEQPRSSSKNVLQDKLVNIDTNSNSSSGFSMLDKSNLGLFKSNSMPSFEEAAKMRARRQISFDSVDFPKR